MRVTTELYRESSVTNGSGLTTKRLSAIWMIRCIALTALISLNGCIFREANISDRIPNGKLVPIDQVPQIVLPDVKRKTLPDGTTVERCDGDIYRFNYPDGTILFRNSRGEECGGVI